MLKVLVLASGNPGKIREAQEILGRHADVLLMPMTRYLPGFQIQENGQTFDENAKLKALAVYNAIGKPAIADDSGLCVEALGGRPGLHSARYAGPGATDLDRCLKLQAEMRGQENRRAAFQCSVAAVLPVSWFQKVDELLPPPACGSLEHAEPHAIACFHGTLSGCITEDLRGREGFGFDPLFAPHGCGGDTLAELGVSRKNELSHRARALVAFIQALARQKK